MSSLIQHAAHVHAAGRLGRDRSALERAVTDAAHLPRTVLDLELAREVLRRHLLLDLGPGSHHLRLAGEVLAATPSASASPRSSALRRATPAQNERSFLFRVRLAHHSGIVLAVVRLRRGAEGLAADVHYHHSGPSGSDLGAEVDRVTAAVLLSA